MFLNNTIKVEAIKIGNNMNTAKTMNKDLEKLISILLLEPMFPLNFFRHVRENF